MGIRFFINLLFFTIFTSCKNNTEKQENYDTIINLKETIGIESLPVKPLQSTQIIPLEFTEKSILQNINIEGITNQYIAISDVNNLYFFDTQGTFLSSISRKGNGPEEYIDITYSWIDFSKKEAHLYDLHRKSIKKYDFSGNFIEEKKSIHLMSFTELNPNEFIAYNGTHSNFEFAIYDKKWNIKDSIIQRKEKVDTKDFSVIKSFQKSNDNVFFYDKSIIYECKNKEIFPKIFLEKGNLQIPDEVMYDIKRKKERQQYIWGDFVTLAGDYLFINFYYDNKKYYDVWNVKNQKLLYRNIMSSPNDLSGITISVNGKEVRGWIKYFEDNALFFTISENEQEKLEIDNQGNPILVVIDLKEFEINFLE